MTTVTDSAVMLVDPAVVYVDTSPTVPGIRAVRGKDVTWSRTGT